MKKSIKIIIFLLAIISIFSVSKINQSKVYAYDDTVKNNDVRVSVYGEATTEVESDTVIVNGVIQTYNQDSTALLDTFNTLKNKIIELGIIEENVNVNYCYSSYQQYNYQTPVYHTTLNFDVKIEDNAKLVEVCDIISTFTNCKVESLNYTYNDCKTVYEEVLATAIDNAKTKANNLLKTQLNVKRIYEEPSYCCNTVYKDYISSEQINPTEKINIIARVKVVFE